jgi:thioredoxin reductase
VEPHVIASKAKEQVLRYPTVKFVNGKVAHARRSNSGFEIDTERSEQFTSRRLLFATGLKDIFPSIDGFEACWGKSIVHCPYCHGYEARGLKTVVLTNGELAFDYVKLIRNLTDDVVLLTNGPSKLTQEQTEALKRKSIQVIETPLTHIEQKEGQIETVILQDATRIPAQVLYWKPTSRQHCPLPEQLGCELTEQGLLKVDAMQKTTIAGIFAAGDSSNWRSVASAVSSGSFAGAVINKELADEDFLSTV